MGDGKRAALLLLLLLTLTPASAGAQIGSGGLAFVVGVPQGEFYDNVKTVGLGLSLDAAVRIPESPLIIGGNFGFIVYGHDTRKEPFSLTIPDVTVDVTTSNNIFHANLLLRLQPATGSVRPYIDGLVGFKYLFTQTSIRNESDPGADPIAESTNFDDFTLGYGGSVGLAILLSDTSEKRLETGEGVFGVLLDLRLRYLLGGEAQYLTKGPAYDAGGNINSSQSKTDMLIPTIGISIVF